MRIFRKIIGGLLIAFAICGGIFVAIMLFINGVEQIVNAIHEGWIATDIAIGLAKLVFGIPLAEMSAMVVAFIGSAIFHD